MIGNLTIEQVQRLRAEHGCPPLDIAWRTCLLCGELFESWGTDNRRCDDCDEAVSNMAFDERYIHFDTGSRTGVLDGSRSVVVRFPDFNGDGGHGPVKHLICGGRPVTD
jgi:hypothetical protein